MAIGNCESMLLTFFDNLFILSEIPSSLLLRGLILGTLPSTAISAILNTNEDFLIAIRALKDLCTLQTIGDRRRPICTLVSYFIIKYLDAILFCVTAS
jgi:hypothetical protein